MTDREPQKIPFFRPYIGEDEEDAVLRVLRSGWLTTGAEALAFEKEFAAFFESEDFAGKSRLPLNALAVNSATSGLHLALEALGVSKGDVVIVPSYTFTATAEIAFYLGAEVAFVDVVKDSFLMDPEKLEETVARLASGKSAYPHGGPHGRPAAIIPVHFAGLPCDMAAIMKISEKYAVPVVEDAAHAFPAWCNAGNTRPDAGTIGDIGVFSFYATKTITTGEGGMLVTRNKKLAGRVQMMRLHGIDRPVWKRYTDSKASWYYEVEQPGYKYNLPDILAALGRVQLKRAVFLFEQRRLLSSRYDNAFRDDKRFIIPPTSGGDARHHYPLRINAEKCTLSRNDIIENLQEHGIGVSVHFIPLHTLPFYKKRYNLCEEEFPETMKSFSAEISLPLWPGMKDEQIGRVIKTVQDVC
jgi:dTDP-4-amino-4,6-dideoxygalactose transaminase